MPIDMSQWLKTTPILDHGGKIEWLYINVYGEGILIESTQLKAIS